MLIYDVFIPPKVLITLALFFGIWVIRFLWLSALKRTSRRFEEKQKNWISVVKNLSNLALLIGIAVIWLSELQNFAISVAAFTVAIVLATKEVLQCFLGFFTWFMNRPFRVGDWIQINDQYGEVADIDWIKFRMLEVDFENGYTYTGRSITVMNSVLLTQHVISLNFMRRYVMHKFSIYRDDSVNLFELREPIADVINELILPFQEVASRYSSLISKRLEIEATSIEPFIDIHTTDQTHQVISVTIFCPTEEAHELEQKITERFMALWYAQKKKTN
ncbi:Mechanosensitive ion channel [Vibrio aerogenes CECT 7868]|uniref:Mechanosensitive ion channel n=1 Tax=Vibrio aerogenes CECT 7868 TaxID=1216006 RepID=A0A1M5Y3J9_9VIBR|nr:mechanosensitive ion channel domain-containing protein [Vibrio aerogenes]SHI06083.1 Mechanosensitive ion channel [Vibrio aerogenes CECT 7868]